MDAEQFISGLRYQGWLYSDQGLSGVATSDIEMMKKVFPLPLFCQQRSERSLTVVAESPSYAMQQFLMLGGQVSLKSYFKYRT